MSPRKLFVTSSNEILLSCPSCYYSKLASITNIIGHQQLLYIKCKCKTIFHVELEFRQKKRKNTNLSGYYCIPSEENDWGRIPDWSQGMHVRTVNCTIRNLSMNGVGFVALNRHNIKEDTRLVVKFMLDNSARLLIEKNVLVRVVNGNYIGCEFFEEEQNDSNLGFYVM